MKAPLAKQLQIFGAGVALASLLGVVSVLAVTPWINAVATFFGIFVGLLIGSASLEPGSRWTRIGVVLVPNRNFSPSQVFLHWIGCVLFIAFCLLIIFLYCPLLSDTMKMSLRACLPHF